MKTKYTLFRRGEMFYMQDSATGKQTSLHTKDETEAKSLLEARNAAQRQPVLNLHLARAYLTASDPAFVERTWQVSHGRTHHFPPAPLHFIAFRRTQTAETGKDSGVTEKPDSSRSRGFARPSTAIGCEASPTSATTTAPRALSNWLPCAAHSTLTTHNQPLPSCCRMKINRQLSVKVSVKAAKS
jgi:hypothetical protein